jgi:hypothetical protein
MRRFGFNPTKVRYSGSTFRCRIAWNGLCFLQKTVFSLTPTHLSSALRSPRVITAVGVGVVAAIGVASYLLTRRKPTAEEMERERRDLLAHSGRITDGTIMDTMITEVHNAGLNASDVFLAVDPSIPTPIPTPPTTPAPQIIVYNYRIAGVTYECAQDVSMLAEYVHGIRADLPVQVRYAPHNPANSIVVAESWSGLRLSSSPASKAD